jgi:imidazolonepropionase-like amidohydrolase
MRVLARDPEPGDPAGNFREVDPMPLRRVLLLLLLLPASLVAAADGNRVTVFDNVRVLTMTRQGVLATATVIVEAGTIVSVSGDPASTLDLDADARIIDGRGMTLMPGLADMHVHYFSDNEGPMFLANGVTTVRNLWGTSDSFVFDARSNAGVTAGPHVYTSGPLMDGPEPIWGDESVRITSPGEIVGAIDSQRAVGFRAVKLYEGLGAEAYRAAVAAAKERNLQVYTHVPDSLTVDQVIELEVDSIEHLDNVADYAFVAGDAPAAAGYFTRWANADEERLEALARLSAEKGVWHSPTYAVIAKRYQYGAAPDVFFDLPESGYIGPFLSDWWRESASRMTAYDDEKRRAAANQLAFIRMLYDADAPLLIGTDTPNPFVLPGFAIHDELDAFVAAGIPVADVLKIATREAARFLREEGQWGVVAEGARADLVLLHGDPLEDLSTLKSPSGVMVNGHWYGADRLATELAAAKERAAAEAASGTD